MSTHYYSTWWFRQTLADLIRHEGFRKYAYADPLSALYRKYPKAPWGYKPARNFLPAGEDLSKGAPWTVGYGFTEGVTPAHIMERNVADRRLEVELSEHLYVLDRLVPQWEKLPEVVITVLANMAFNLGYARLSKFAPTLNEVSKGNYQVAANRLKKTLWYKQTGSRAEELVKRLETLQVDKRYEVPRADFSQVTGGSSAYIPKN